MTALVSASSPVGAAQAAHLSDDTGDLVETRFDFVHDLEYRAGPDVRAEDRRLSIVWLRVESDGDTDPTTTSWRRRWRCRIGCRLLYLGEGQQDGAMRLAELLEFRVRSGGGPRRRGPRSGPGCPDTRPGDAGRRRRRRGAHPGAARISTLPPPSRMTGSGWSCPGGGRRSARRMAPSWSRRFPASNGSGGETGSVHDAGRGDRHLRLDERLRVQLAKEVARLAIRR